MTVLAPPEHAARLSWTAADMNQSPRWRFDASPAALRDSAALAAWATSLDDAANRLERGSVHTPGLDALGDQIAAELDHGWGVAWVRGFESLDENALRLTFLKLGLRFGPTIETYGRLYEVRDSGASYRDAAIPVSQTRASTGMHTDSSGKHVRPHVVGLACVRQAASGGRSRVASAARVHEVLRAKSPELLRRLYGSFVRDIVTPGSDRATERVAQNRFPVFSYDGRLGLRYMRYWIERGHQVVGEPLDALDVAAFNALDDALQDPEHVLSVMMQPGQLLFIDNTTTVHDRDEYVDTAGAPRLMLRLWIDHQTTPTKSTELQP
jgi:alpha-ketoglutarate-dependent taurine dioxygenase